MDVEMQNRKELFFKTRQFWPVEISIEDNVFSDENAKNQDLLNSIYKNIEASIEQGDDWLQVSIWAFHQALSLFIKDKAAPIFVNEVDYSVYETMMFENLNGDECWRSELEIYNALNIE
jgi:hypothetical protein